MIGIQLRRTGGGWVVWDVEAVPDYRAATSMVDGGVAAAIARLVRACAEPAIDHEAGDAATAHVGDIIVRQGGPA